MIMRGMSWCRTWTLAAGIVLACTAACTSLPQKLPAAASPSPPTVPMIRSALTVWPEATLTLPGQVKGGSYVRPVALLSKNEALMVTSYSARPTFYSYDLKTRQHRALATAPKWGECGLCYEIHSVALSETWIAWTAEVYRSESWNAGHRHMELWAMPRSGGPMRLVTWLTGHGDVAYDDHLSIAGEHAIWIGNVSEGYRVPLSGGAAERISPTPPASVPIPGTREAQCTGEWCVGRVPPRPHALTTLIVQRRDGSHRTEIPASTGEGALLAGRFGWFSLPYVYGDDSANQPNWHSLLYDVCTGKSGRLGAGGKTGRAFEIHQGAAGSVGEILFWATSKKERSWTVLDVSRIPACIPSDNSGDSRAETGPAD